MASRYWGRCTSAIGAATCARWRLISHEWSNVGYVKIESEMERDAALMLMHVVLCRTPRRRALDARSLGPESSLSLAPRRWRARIASQADNRCRTRSKQPQLSIRPVSSLLHHLLLVRPPKSTSKLVVSIRTGRILAAANRGVVTSFSERSPTRRMRLRCYFHPSRHPYVQESNPMNYFLYILDLAGVHLHSSVFVFA